MISSFGNRERYGWSTQQIQRAWPQETWTKIARSTGLDIEDFYDLVCYYMARKVLLRRTVALEEDNLLWCLGYIVNCLRTGPCLTRFAGLQYLSK
jgi:hypothetical protein